MTDLCALAYHNIQTIEATNDQQAHIEHSIQPLMYHILCTF